MGLLTLAKKSLDKGTMIAEGLDLGIQGVLGIWKGAAEINDQKQVSERYGSYNRSIILSRS